MKTPIFVAALAVMILAPFGLASAHEHSSALRINNTTAIYTITYEFQAGKEAYYLPIMTQNALPYGSKSAKVGYVAVQNGKLVPTGYTAQSLVVSDLPIVGDKYRIEPMKRGSVTVVTIVKKTTPDVANVGLQLTNIPYYKGTVRAIVKEKDLSTFNTDTVVLGTPVSKQ